MLTKKTYSIHKDGNLYLEAPNEKEANKIFGLVMDIYKPRVLQMFEHETTTRLLKDSAHERNKKPS